MAIANEDHSIRRLDNSAPAPSLGLLINTESGGAGV